MQKWEYKTLILSGSQEKEALEKLGELGWELVSTTEQPSKLSTKFYFKRPVQKVETMPIVTEQRIAGLSYGEFLATMNHHGFRMVVLTSDPPQYQLHLPGGLKSPPFQNPGETYKFAWEYFKLLTPGTPTRAR